MSILSVRIYPDPVLRLKSQPVTEFSKEFRAFTKNLIETMYAHKGCVGISAPQIGVLQRVLVVDVSNNRRTAVHNGLIVLVNPVIFCKERTIVSREGCLSIPDHTGNVNRFERVVVEGQDIYGRPVTVQTGGFEAIAFQHEIDHLDGILFIDRVMSKKDIFRRKKRAR